MQELPCSPIKLFLFPDSIRRCYHLCGLLTAGGLLLFSVFMFFVAFTQVSSKLHCFMVGFLFTVFDTLYTIIWLKNFKIIDATYQISDITVENYMGSRTISVRLDKAYFQENVAFSLSFGYSKMALEYVVFSENKISNDVWEEGNLYKKMKSVWGTNSVFIPNDAGIRLPLQKFRSL